MTKMQLMSTLASSPAKVEHANRMVDLVERLVTMFPQLAANTVNRRLMIKEWSEGLADMSEREIERGVSRCRTRTFPPSLGEFAQFCRPALDPEVAFLEAQDGLRARDKGEVGRWSHPAIWRAACAMSPEVRGGSFAAHRKRWEHALRNEYELGWGEDVPAPAKRIEHAHRPIPMPAHVRERLAKSGLKLRGRAWDASLCRKTGVPEVSRARPVVVKEPIEGESA